MTDYFITKDNDALSEIKVSESQIQSSALLKHLILDLPNNFTDKRIKLPEEIGIKLETIKLVFECLDELKIEKEEFKQTKVNNQQHFHLIEFFDTRKKYLDEMGNILLASQFLQIDYLLKNLNKYIRAKIVSCETVEDIKRTFNCETKGEVPKELEWATQPRE